MLYTVPLQPGGNAPIVSPNFGLHYFDSADLLLRLQAEGRSRAEMSRLTGLTLPRVTDRLRLTALEEGLRAYLRRENVPERIALTLLTLPDPLTRRRIAQRIVRERLCIRDAALLVASARRRYAAMRPPKIQEKRVIAAIRDTRLYHNALRDIAGQMNAAGLRTTFTERRSGCMMEMTIAYSCRRRRTQRHQAM